MFLEGALIAGVVAIAAGNKIRTEAKNKQTGTSSENFDPTVYIKGNVDFHRQKAYEQLQQLGNKKIAVMNRTLSEFYKLYSLLEKKNKKNILCEMVSDYWDHKKLEILNKDLSAINKMVTGYAVQGIPVRNIIFYGFTGSVNVFVKPETVRVNNMNQSLLWLGSGNLPIVTDYTKIFNGGLSEASFAATYAHIDRNIAKRYSKGLKDRQYVEQAKYEIDALIPKIEFFCESNYAILNLLSNADKLLNDTINDFYNSDTNVSIDKYNLGRLSLLKIMCFYARICYEICGLVLLDDIGKQPDNIQKYLMYNHELIDNGTIHDLRDILKNGNDSTLSDTISEPLTEFNIRIINDERFSYNTTYQIAYKGDTKWGKPNLNAKLCVDERLKKLTKNDLEYLLEDMDFELGIGSQKTFIYYIGNEIEACLLQAICVEKYPSIKVKLINR